MPAATSSKTPALDVPAAPPVPPLRQPGQAGAVPVTWLSVMLEWQADWSNTETAASVVGIMRDDAKAVGAAAQYLQAMRG